MSEKENQERIREADAVMAAATALMTVWCRKSLEGEEVEGLSCDVISSRANYRTVQIKMTATVSGDDDFSFLEFVKVLSSMNVPIDYDNDDPKVVRLKCQNTMQFPES